MGWLEEYGNSSVYGLAGLDTVDKEFLREAFHSLPDLENYLKENHLNFLLNGRALKLYHIAEYLYTLKEEEL